MSSEYARRGLTISECLVLCGSPGRLSLNATKFKLWKSLRDKILLRLIYETFCRISELLNVKITDIDFEHCAILVTRPKGKAIFKIIDGKRTHVDTVHKQRWVFFGDETRDLIIRYLEGRKRGYLITTSWGKRMSSRQAERIVDYYARKEGIQKVIGYTKDGKQVRLANCKALRESGERHVDEAGGDRDATSRTAGHSTATKERYYKLGSFESDRRIVRDHHPLMNARPRRKRADSHA